MRQVSGTLEVETRGPGLVEVSGAVEDWVSTTGIHEGLLTVFIAHTSASLTIQENADPAVQRDLVRFFERIAPELDGYEHSSEGPDDMPAHIKSALTEVSLSLPVRGGRPLLGTWQGIYLCEHRSRAHRRKVHLHILGD